MSIVRSRLFILAVGFLAGCASTQSRYVLLLSLA